MSDRLFTLAQEIARIRQQCQQGLSETKAYDDGSQTNRLLALEQDLTSLQPEYDDLTYANAYGFKTSRKRRDRYRDRSDIESNPKEDNEKKPSEESDQELIVVTIKTKKDKASNSKQNTQEKPQKDGNSEPGFMEETMRNNPRRRSERMGITRDNWRGGVSEW